METLCQYLHHLLSFYLSLAAAISRCPFSPFPKSKSVASQSSFPSSTHFSRSTSHSHATWFNAPSIWTVRPPCISGPRPPQIQQTQFDHDPWLWRNSKWQFFYQVGSLAESFNVYIPDLLFFGKSYTNCTNRTEAFQAECVVSALRRVGVERCSVYAISYGGYVGYRMAEIYPEMVEKMVIVSSGVGCTQSLKGEHLKRVGLEVVDVLLPEKPEGLRLLGKLVMYKSNPFTWVPDFILHEFIDVMCNANRKEKQELVEHLLAKSAECKIQTLSQETLLFWGDKDMVFLLSFAHNLQRSSGPKSKLAVIRDTGHAANIDSPDSLNALIKEFI